MRSVSANSSKYLCENIQVNVRTGPPRASFRLFLWEIDSRNTDRKRDEECERDTQERKRRELGNGWRVDS